MPFAHSLPAQHHRCLLEVHAHDHRSDVRSQDEHHRNHLVVHAFDRIDRLDVGDNPLPQPGRCGFRQLPRRIQLLKQAGSSHLNGLSIDCSCNSACRRGHDAFDESGVRFVDRKFQLGLVLKRGRFFGEVGGNGDQHLQFAGVKPLHALFGRSQRDQMEGRLGFQRLDHFGAEAAVLVDDADAEIACPVIDALVSRHPDARENDLEQNSRHDSDDRHRLS
ncbi:hypothetical protein BN871_AC_01080 [Paenibacillus sp. P22]|nr:hypothetical protein BN871_AC_01080 [Paenibacillus sp. P22]